MSILSARSRSSRFLRVFITLVLALTGTLLSISPSNAVPGAPTITSISSSSASGPVDVTVNFTRANAGLAQPAGYIYSTDTGTTWAQCNTSANCTWDGSSSQIVIKKLSNDTPRLQAGVPYVISIAECTNGTANTDRQLTANLSAVSFGLRDCGTSSSDISYVGGTTFTATAAPTITISGSISYGDSGATLTVGGSDFETTTSLSLFTIGVGTTGLTATNVSRTNASELVFTFTGTAAMGTITIQAKTTAFGPVASAASNTVSKAVTAVVPGAPTGLDTTTVRGTEVALSWTAPTSNGGSAITTYAVQYSSNGGGSWSTFTHTASTATSINVTGLSSSTAYLFKVAATNSIGTGSYTSNLGPVTTLTPPTVPETPTAVSAGSATSSALTVSWSAPSRDGGATIDVYRVQYSTDGITWTTASSTATSPYTVTGLSASTSYVFKVAAHNSVGWGPYSDSSTAVSTSAASSPAPEPERFYPPTIDSLSKLKVCARGHDEFIIRGNNFKNALVTIDGVQVTIKGKSDGIINLSFGEATEGKKTIKITNPAGSVTAEIEFKMVDKTAFKVFDIPYIYKGGFFLYQFEAFGENTFRVTGNMPAGLALNAETGEISGTPTEEGKFNFVLHADGLCGNDVDVIKLDIDKEIPNAISHRIKFPNKKSKNITGTAQYELKKFFEQIKKISPKQIDPVIYVSGGAPKDEPEADSQSAKDRRDSLCSVMLNEEVYGQIVFGLFDGEEDEIEIFVYWPVAR